MFNGYNLKHFHPIPINLKKKQLTKLEYQGNIYCTPFFYNFHLFLMIKAIIKVNTCFTAEF